MVRSSSAEADNTEGNPVVGAEDREPGRGDGRRHAVHDLSSGGYSHFSSYAT
jgi:hypothetical protein